MFEPAQLPQETIFPSVAFAKGQIGNSKGQHIIYYNIKLSLSYPINYCLSAAQGKIRHFYVCDRFEMLSKERSVRQ